MLDTFEDLTAVTLWPYPAAVMENLFLKFTAGLENGKNLTRKTEGTDEGWHIMLNVRSWRDDLIGKRACCTSPRTIWILSSHIGCQVTHSCNPSSREAERKTAVT